MIKTTRDKLISITFVERSQMTNTGVKRILRNVTLFGGEKKYFIIAALR
jgi:hypothetical protein